MEVISIERSTYEELHPRLTPAPYQGTLNVSQMKEMAGRGTDKRLILKSTASCSISLWMWRVFFMLWQEGTRIVKCVISERVAYERIDNAS